LANPFPVSPLPSAPPFPVLARSGVVLMAFGLLLDFVEHDLVSHVNERTVAGFPLSEHGAHLVVVIGMVLVIGGIVRAGMRVSRQTNQPRQHRSLHDAVR
jgi:uncharacterized membrane protein YidH (DUF202 family)